VFLGIDIGGTTTDIVSFDQGQLSGFLTVTANDPVTSASGALGKFVNRFQVPLGQIESVAVTGVGAGSLGSDLFGIPLVKVDEFRAVGMGGLYLSGLKKAVVVSMGTGTAVVRAEGSQVQHLGGTGVGGGTLIGLAKYMLQITDFDTLIELAEQGDLTKVDLSISDITELEIGSLSPDVTASNFGKHSDKATDNDLALGIVNLVCQTIGVVAVFASRNYGIDTVVLSGKMIRIPQIGGIFKRLESLFGVSFEVPANAEFATAVGAASTLLKQD
jgi:type II pantothenate kinase